MDESDSDPVSTPDNRIARRAALKAAGLGVAGVAALDPAVAQAADESDHPGRGRGNRPDEGFPRELLNPRTRNADHAWRRGYRGRADRTVGITDTGVEGRHGDLGPWSGIRVSNDVSSAGWPTWFDRDADEEVTVEAGADGLEDVDLPKRNDLPELIWHRSGGDLDRPRDTSGHGTSVASIAAGTGRARTIDPDGFTTVWPFGGEDEGEAVPAEGSLDLQFTVPAEDGEGEATIYAAATGRWFDVVLRGPDGEELDSASAWSHEYDRTASSGVTSDAERPTLESPTVHDSDADESERTYELEVSRWSPPETSEGARAGEIRLAAVGKVLEPGTDLEDGGNVNSLSVPGDLREGRGPSFHAGVAPGYSIIGTNGSHEGFTGLEHAAETFVRHFGLRAINMSWGDPAGTPTSVVDNPVDDISDGIARLARAGVVSHHAVMNQPGTPAGGMDTGSGAPESISCVMANRLYGIHPLSSGGVGVVDQDGEFFGKPDVTAYGVTETAARRGEDTDPGEYGEEESYRSGSGTSFATPSVCGLTGLVMQAMEEDGPDGLDLPAPAELFEDGRDEEDRLAWVLRTKQVVLATASTTAFNAIPWHGDQAPVYAPGERDPYEGFGRINHGAAVDAVSRDLASGPSGTDVLGLDVPDDLQAVAGYLTGPGEYEVSLGFDGYRGSEADRAQGPPNVDLVVYDGRNPEGLDDGPATGDPNVVASDRLVDGPGADRSVTVELDEDDVYLVVAKLVSVPGDGTRRLPAAVVDELPPEASGVLFNGTDVRADVDLDVVRRG